MKPPILWLESRCNVHEQIAHRQVPRRTSAQPIIQTDDDDDAIYQTRPPSSAIRYTDARGNRVIQEGRRKVVIHQETHPSRGLYRWMIFMGLFVFCMVIGWILFTALGYWWQGKQEDWKYGSPFRTFQVDQYVGHGDTPDHPDHFIAVHFGGVIEVVELNPLQPKYDHVYPITTVNDSTTPVVIGFEDTNHDGKLDMLVTVGDSNSYTVILLNTGSQFTK
jgi:hypothetical protein